LVHVAGGRSFIATDFVPDFPHGLPVATKAEVLWRFAIAESKCSIFQAFGLPIASPTRAASAAAMQAPAVAPEASESSSSPITDLPATGASSKHQLRTASAMK
jgi:hypothetical protein